MIDPYNVQVNSNINKKFYLNYKLTDPSFTNPDYFEIPLNYDF